ncbi:zinc-dependent peptidase [Maribacter sp. SA7]|uniref:M90 family metallopeptidase n=1 Tax=Maribacter zhoushanensis TaxID=3030012 RepID=UPI0023EC43F9|nr:M90 family metallopeptidase [Maribacter zhoushanensis]MDF4204954.1 zinc-dependent peptidase [Maribacter zhoushanensis]
MLTIFVYFLPLLLFVIFIIWRLWFYKKTIDFKDFNPKWRSTLNKEVSFYKELSVTDRTRFEKELLYFFEDVTITGVKIEIDDTDRLLVAASAVIPLFGFPELRYRNINEVLLYQGSFNDDHQTEGDGRNILGKVGKGNMNRLMILSLPALRAGFKNENSSSNVGIHEFVHLIDMADGTVDGIPESLMQKQYVAPWLKLMHKEIESIKKNKSDINPYGATSEIEFFSVASEYFFNNPEKFQDKHPELYNLMKKMYRYSI